MTKPWGVRVPFVAVSIHVIFSKPKKNVDKYISGITANECITAAHGLHIQQELKVPKSIKIH